MYLMSLRSAFHLPSPLRRGASSWHPLSAPRVERRGRMVAGIFKFLSGTSERGSGFWRGLGGSVPSEGQIARLHVPSAEHHTWDSTLFHPWPRRRPLGCPLPRWWTWVFLQLPCLDQSFFKLLVGSPGGYFSLSLESLFTILCWQRQLAASSCEVKRINKYLRGLEGRGRVSRGCWPLLTQPVGMGIGNGKNQSCQGRKVTKLKQEKMETWWRKPVGLASSLEAFTGLGEEGNKLDFEGCQGFGQGRGLAEGPLRQREVKP